MNNIIILLSIYLCQFVLNILINVWSIPFYTFKKTKSQKITIEIIKKVIKTYIGSFGILK